VQISAIDDSKSTTLIVAVAPARLLSSGRVVSGHGTHPVGTRVYLCPRLRCSRARCTSERMREVPAAFRRRAWLVLRIEETNLFRSISRRIRPETHRAAARRPASWVVQVNTNSPRLRFDYNSKDGRSMTYWWSNVR